MTVSETLFSFILCGLSGFVVGLMVAVVIHLI